MTHIEVVATIVLMCALAIIFVVRSYIEHMQWVGEMRHLNEKIEAAQRKRDESAAVRARLLQRLADKEQSP